MYTYIVHIYRFRCFQLTYDNPSFILGHVIPRDHLLPIALGRGSSGLQLDFTYQSRATPAMVCHPDFFRHVLRIYEHGDTKNEIVFEKTI